MTITKNGCFLMFIFTLTETGGKEGVPVVTIPAG